LIRAGTSYKAKGSKPEQKQKLSPLELIDSLVPRSCVGTHGVMLCFTGMQSIPSKFPVMSVGSKKTSPSLSNVR